MVPESPHSFSVQTPLRKAAWDNGFRLERSAQNDWLRFGSNTAQGDIWLAGAGPTGPWFLALERPEIAEEIKIRDRPQAILGAPGAASFRFDTLAQLYPVLDRTWRLGVSLPEAPLKKFRAAIIGLPQSTEAERLVVQRIGQSLFRDALMAYWHGTCPMTGITDLALLRASHIVPWAECETDEQRLDVHNGLLLSALWDAAFDAGLITFADDGTVLSTPKLSSMGADALNVSTSPKLAGLTAGHRGNLQKHRARSLFGRHEATETS